MAGRSREKLESVLSEMGKKADKDLSKTPIIIADVNDEKSLVEMAKQAKIIVNCCGPFRYWGEQVVKACIEAGTHHVDVSGEPQYMAKIQLKYNDQAREKEVYIVSACGVESIAAEMGIIYLQKQFNGTLNSVENFFYVYSVDPKIKFGANYGTWASAVNVLFNENELKEIERKLFPEPLPELTPKLTNRGIIHQSEAVENKWCILLPYPDKQVATRSQRFCFDKNRQRPAQIESYLVFDSVLLALVFSLVFFLSKFIVKFKFISKLLLKYPELFSLGYFSRSGPKEEQNENLNFEMTCYGEGWNEKLAEPTDEYNFPLDKKMAVRIRGKNAGYGSTCVALLLSARTILNESLHMPEKGGVFTPGAAFANTTIIEKLQINDITFELLKTR